jgi:hypothetical protein
MIKPTVTRPRIQRRLLTVTARPVRRAPPRVKRRELALWKAKAAHAADAAPFSPDPYVDYARYLTAAGGIAIVYKDIDERWRFLIRRLCLWAGATGAATWLLLYHSPVRSLAVNIVAVIATAIINWLIVRQPVQVFRTIEIRPDSMILDGRDTFWLRYMEGWPAFGPGEDDTQMLSGTYGTRRVEYLTVRGFDEFDSTPAVLAAHLNEAMQQLWSWPY